MEALAERIKAAKHDNNELERLISDYIPFIRKAVSDAGYLPVEYDDKLSLALLTFMNCVRQYETERGNFAAFASACIRNRLIDESRRVSRHAGKTIPLVVDEGERLDEKISAAPEDRAAVAAYQLEQEQENLSDEIDDFSERLEEYGVSFRELPRICPKQERARKQCIEIGRFVADSGEMRENLLRRRRLGQSALANQFGLSDKTIEKHRKYIVTVVILLTGDYPLIRAFLPYYSD